MTDSARGEDGDGGFSFEGDAGVFGRGTGGFKVVADVFVLSVGAAKPRVERLGVVGVDGAGLALPRGVEDVVLGLGTREEDMIADRFKIMDYYHLPQV